LNGKFLTGDILDDRLGLCFIFQFPLLILAVIVGHKGAGLPDPIQRHIQRPVLLGNEGADLIFPVHHQTGGNTLDTAGGKTAADFLPQQR
jgi:hypothetical protein